jgi:hypothetical protein
MFMLLLPSLKHPPEEVTMAAAVEGRRRRNNFIGRTVQT